MTLKLRSQLINFTLHLPTALDECFIVGILKLAIFHCGDPIPQRQRTANYGAAVFIRSLV